MARAYNKKDLRSDTGSVRPLYASLFIENTCILAVLSEADTGKISDSHEFDFIIISVVLSRQDK